MSIRRVVILVTIIIGLIIAISLAVWFLVEPEIQFFIYWIVGIIVAVLTIGAAIVQISGYSLRDLLRNDGYQIPEPKFPPDEIPEDNNLDEQELAVLLYIHDVGGENAVSGVVKVEQIREALSLEYSVIDRICRYLEGERLVKHFDDTGYRWVITHDGKKKARALLKSKETRPSSPEAGSSHPEYATCTEKHHKTILDETPMPYKYDVFLSHNSKDKPAVQELAERLEDEAGIRVFLDIWNLIPGDPWQEDLEEALDQSRTVAVFLSPSGVSGWHNEEMRKALNIRVQDRERRVIPVLLPGTKMPGENEIPGFLNRLTWVDFRNGLDDEISFVRLVAGIKGQQPGRRR